MNKFVDRSARYNLVVPVSFNADDVLIEGVSVNVSESGLLVHFSQPVGIWVFGEISLVVGEYMVSIQAKTARIQGEYMGLSFLIDGEMDKLALDRIMDYAMTQTLYVVPV